MTADLRVDRDLAQDRSVPIEFQNPVLVPLTEMEMFSVMAQVGAGEIRTRDPFRFRKSLAGKVTPKIAVVLRPLAQGEPKLLARGNRGPWNAWRIPLFLDGPFLLVDLIDPAQIARSHP